MSKKNTNSSTTNSLNFGQFFGENKFLVLGGAFLILVIVGAGFLFTSGGNDMAGKFHYTRSYEGAKIGFLGLHANSNVNLEGSTVNLDDEFSLYVRAESKGINMNALTVTI
ncbi:MAG: hypothetical protein QF475_01335, partial [Candidatus Undinarchaeales archaeon]|nr:hypothetical protein [Candidatus Undinarchaeales archaeon]